MAIQTDIKFINAVSVILIIWSYRNSPWLIIIKPFDCYIWVILQMFLKHFKIFIFRAYVVVISIIYQVAIQWKKTQVIQEDIEQ